MRIRKKWVVKEKKEVEEQESPIVMNEKQECSVKSKNLYKILINVAFMN
jgi:hypothetical protein